MVLNKRIFNSVILFIMSSLLLTSCTFWSEPERIPMDTETTFLELNPLNGNKVTFEHEIEGSILETSYYTGDYMLENWRITDSKTITIQVSVKEQIEGSELLVEQVHADVSIKSESPQLNGITQDSMDNSYNGTSQDGYFISEQHSYTNIFAIEGYSQMLINGWGFFVGSYGASSIESTRLTEENIFRNRTYGTQLTVIYNVLVKNKGEEKYHLKTIEDRIIIPTAMYINAIKEYNQRQLEAANTNNSIE